MGFRDRRPEVRSGVKPTVSSSVKLLHAANDNLIERTHDVWKPRLGRDLSTDDARQIAENVTGFFSILIEWARTDMLIAANDNTEHIASDVSEARYER